MGIISTRLLVEPLVIRGALLTQCVFHFVMQEMVSNNHISLIWERNISEVTQLLFLMLQRFMAFLCDCG